MTIAGAARFQQNHRPVASMWPCFLAHNRLLGQKGGELEIVMSCCLRDCLFHIWI